MKFENKFFCFALGFTFLILSVIYLNNVHAEMNIACEFCTGDCLDTNVLCGDFGIYWMKFFSLVFMGIVGIGFIIMGFEGFGLFGEFEK